MVQSCFDGVYFNLCDIVIVFTPVVDSIAKVLDNAYFSVINL